MRSRKYLTKNDILEFMPRKKKNNDKLLAIAGLGSIVAIILMIVYFPLGDLQELSWFKLKYKDFEVEAGDISEESAVWLTGITVVGILIIGGGAVIMKARNSPRKK